MSVWPWLLTVQGAYYCATGVWPLVSLATFERVTGPKVDDWLVQTVGTLALAMGATLVVGARRVRPTNDAKTLSVLSAMAFAAVDVKFVALGTIGPIYLMDAGIQSVFIVASVVFWFGRTEGSGRDEEAAIDVAAKQVKELRQREGRSKDDGPANPR